MLVAKLRDYWPTLLLPLLLFVVLMLAMSTGVVSQGSCFAQPDQRVTTLGGRCAVLVPQR